jgi:hypothetical protein
MFKNCRQLKYLHLSDGFLECWDNLSSLVHLELHYVGMANVKFGLMFQACPLLRRVVIMNNNARPSEMGAAPEFLWLTPSLESLQLRYYSWDEIDRIAQHLDLDAISGIQVVFSELCMCLRLFETTCQEPPGSFALSVIYSRPREAFIVSTFNPRNNCRRYQVAPAHELPSRFAPHLFADMESIGLSMTNVTVLDWSINESYNDDFIGWENLLTTVQDAHHLRELTLWVEFSRIDRLDDYFFTSGRLTCHQLDRVTFKVLYHTWRLGTDVDHLGVQTVSSKIFLTFLNTNLEYLAPQLQTVRIEGIRLDEDGDEWISELRAKAVNLDVVSSIHAEDWVGVGPVRSLITEPSF